MTVPKETDLAKKVISMLAEAGWLDIYQEVVAPAGRFR